MRQMVLFGTLGTLNGDGFYGKKSRIRMGRRVGINACCSIWSKFWSINFSPKAKLLGWKACSNSLPTRSNLRRRNIVVDPACPGCNMDTEDTMHIFFMCSWVRRVWQVWDQDIKRVAKDSEDLRKNIILSWASPNKCEPYSALSILSLNYSSRDRPNTLGLVDSLKYSDSQAEQIKYFLIFLIS
ncbi:hypothetical protein M9H77_18819 [Catharanthus roseus]|uniref:Uncharacterized protein n=1 Tax=Catharanthus roseus TaxID=4058 RepID=A0ACC0B8I8_CATRO|nr:hypothetical protein M9H77_18819 [Catharanthus roseus]